MEFGELYIKWIKYLKKRGLYVKYRYDYSIAVDGFYKRQRAMLNGRVGFWRISSSIEISRSEKFLNGPDCFLHVKNNSLDIHRLITGLFLLDSQLRGFGITPRKIWYKVGEEFGVLERLYEKPKPTTVNWGIIDEEDYGGIWSSASSISESTNLARSRNEASTGQWYDRFYNRGRNFNNRNNIRWRR